MDVDAFWELIERIRANAHDDEHLVEGLATALLALPTEEILDLEEQLSEAKHQAYRWEVWGAAYLINAGCSDDGSRTSAPGSSRKVETPLGAS
jgi:Protein of unknown function (DUF4240)